jgi:phosphomevalonate kinase
LANILLITNVTANTIIYNFADSTNGATSFANNVLTLDHNTISMNSTDVLQIYLDLAGEESLHDLLRRMNKLLESNAVVDSSLRQRVTLDAIGSTPTALTTTVPVSGTVTATANVSNGVASQLVSNSATNPYTLTSSTTGLIMEGPVHQLWRIANDAQTCYASAIRSKLTFS